MNTTDSQLDSSVFEGFKGITDVYELRRTVELDVKGQPIRIELWYWHSNKNCRWEARVYRRMNGSANWVLWEGFPYAQDRDEETTMLSALNFLDERIQEKTEGGFQKSIPN